VTRRSARTRATGSVRIDLRGALGHVRTWAAPATSHNHTPRAPRARTGAPGSIPLHSLSTQRNPNRAAKTRPIPGRSGAPTHPLQTSSPCARPTPPSIARGATSVAPGPRSDPPARTKPKAGHGKRGQRARTQRRTTGRMRPFSFFAPPRFPAIPATIGSRAQWAGACEASRMRMAAKRRSG
jgi:hypothetical protein